MVYYLLKLFISAAIIVLVSEVAKWNAMLGGLIKSLPLISIMALIWLYIDTRDVTRAAALSNSTFWFVLPTLPTFLIFPFLIKKGMGFYTSLSLSIVVMLGAYFLSIAVLKWFEFKF